MEMDGEPIDYEALGKFVVDALKQMENQRRFAGLDIECVFDIFLSDNTTYRCTLFRADPEEEA